MKMDIYINNEVRTCNKGDLKVLEKFFNVEEDYKIFNTNDLNDIYHINARKVFTEPKDIVDFITFLINNDLEDVITNTRSTGKLIGIKKTVDCSIEELNEVIIPGIIFINKNHSTVFNPFSVREVITMTGKEISEYNWIFDIEWKHNANRNDRYKALVHDIVKLIRKFDISYSSTSRRKMLVAKTTRKK